MHIYRGEGDEPGKYTAQRNRLFFCPGERPPAGRVYVPFFEKQFFYSLRPLTAYVFSMLQSVTL